MKNAMDSLYKDLLPYNIEGNKFLNMQIFVYQWDWFYSIKQFRYSSSVNSFIITVMSTDPKFIKPYCTIQGFSWWDNEIK